MTEIATEIIAYGNDDEDGTEAKLSVSYDVRANTSSANGKSRNEDRYGRYEVLNATDCEAELEADHKRRTAEIEQVRSQLDNAETGRYSPETSQVLKCFTLEQANSLLTRFTAKTGIQFTLLGKYGEVGFKSEPQKRAELDANAKRLHFKSARVDYDGCAHALLAEEYFVCRCGVAERSWSYMHAPEADLVRRFQHRKTCLKQRLKRQLGITTNRSTRIAPEKRRELDRRLENEWQMRLETYRQTGELTEEEYTTLVTANSSHRRPKQNKGASGVSASESTRKRKSYGAGADDDLSLSTSAQPENEPDGETDPTVKKERDQLSTNERNIFIYVTQIFRFPQYRLLEDTPNARSRLFAALRNDWLMPAVNVTGECIYIVRLPSLANHQHTLTDRQLRTQLSMRTDLDVGLTDRSRVVRPVDKRGIPRWVGERVYFTVSEDVIQFIRRLLLEEHVHDDYAIQQRIKQRFVSRHGYAPSHGDYFNYPTRPLIRHYMRKFVPTLFADENDTSIVAATVAAQPRRAAAGDRALDLFTKKKRQREFAVDGSLSLSADQSFDRPVKLEPAARQAGMNMLRMARRDASASNTVPSRVPSQARQYRVGDSLAKKRIVGDTVVTQHDPKSFNVGVTVGEPIANVDVYSYPEEADETEADADVDADADADAEADPDGDVQVEGADGAEVSYSYADIPPTGYDYADADGDTEAHETTTHSHSDAHAASTIEYASALEIVE